MFDFANDSLPLTLNNESNKKRFKELMSDEFVADAFHLLQCELYPLSSWEDYVHTVTKFVIKNMPASDGEDIVDLCVLTQFELHREQLKSLTHEQLEKYADKFDTYHRVHQRVMRNHWEDAL